MTNARPEKKVISKLNSNAVNSGDIRFNECHDQYTAYLNDLLRPLEEAYKKWYPNAKYDTELELAIKSVLAKHKAGTGEVDEVKWPEKRIGGIYDVTLAEKHRSEGHNEAIDACKQALEEARKG